MKIETTNGTIDIRTPNYPEAMRLLGSSGLSSGDNDHYECLAIIAESASKFIEKINIKGVKSYDDLLASTKYSEEINLIVTKVAKCLEEFATVKKKS